jgi:hypothetical protein
MDEATLRRNGFGAGSIPAGDVEEEAEATGFAAVKLLILGPGKALA